MNAHDALDWGAIRAVLSAAARTAMGRAIVEAPPTPLGDVATIARAHDEIGEVLAIRAAGRDVPTGGVTDIADAVRRCALGEVAEGQVLSEIGSSLAAMRSLRRALDVDRRTAPALADVAQAIVLDGTVIDDLIESVLPDGSLSELRWPELRDLRAAVAMLHQSVRDTLDRMIAGDELADKLQDRFWTLRDDRYVLPIRTDVRSWDLGVVHGTSNSGRTVFVEPTAVLALHNRLKLAEGELRAAERRIWVQLSREAGTQDPGLPAALAAVARVDAAVARAALAQRWKGTRPKVGDEGVVSLHSARHPVLALREVDVVPNDLSLSATSPFLVLSGANAGGKTIALKTIGLCALLAAAGHFVPAADGSRVDRFDVVLASIGDAQTVAGDRSSFSGHVAWLADALADARPGVLVLLDELCTGTDPAQGAALGRAVLEAFATAGCRGVVTTHHALLKALPWVDARFVGAAVQHRDGRATYRVERGAVGESHAMGVARARLPSAVVDRAEAIVAEGDGADAFAALEAERERAREAVEAAVRAREEAEAERAALAADRARLAAKQARAAEAERGELAERVAAARAAIGQVVAALQREPTQAGARAARAAVDALAEVGAVPSEAWQSGDLPAVGARVRDLRLGAEGVVVGLGDGLAMVRVGAVTRAARPEELEVLPERKTKSAAKRTFAKPRPEVGTLDVRGMRVEEGLARIDDAIAEHGAAAVLTVIHGHGTGAMKLAVRRHLTQHTRVAEWDVVSAGDDGATRLTVRG